MPPPPAPAPPPISATEVRLLSKLLERALALPAAEREAFLAALPVHQQPLVPRLRERLAAIERPPDPQAPPPAPAPRPRPAPRAEERVGPYRLLKPLAGRATAGEAQVWQAERADDPAHRLLALRLGALPGSVAADARMASDYQVVNLPEHPAVQRIVDAGFDERGRFYRVMPLVEGTSLVEHVRHRGVNLRRRVELMLEVSQVVAMAHVERVALGDLSEDTLRIADEGQRLVMLDWGRGRMLRPDTAVADLHALGAVFAAFFESDGPARQPSPGPDLAVVLQRLRQAGPGTGRGGVGAAGAPGYANVAALLDDLQRVLEYRPVAGPHVTALHRARLFVRRRRLPLAGAAAGVAALVLAGNLLLGYFSSRQQQEARADAVAEFLAEAVPAATPAEPAVLAPLLQAALERARTGFPGKPILRGQVMTALAVRFRELDQPEQALAVLREAHALLQGNARPGDPALHGAQAELAVELAATRTPAGTAEARQLAQRVLDHCGTGAPLCAPARHTASAVLAGR